MFYFPLFFLKRNFMGCVYLLADAEKEGYYKIGVTRGSIEKRIKKLQTGNAGEIYIVNYYECSHPFLLEKMLHTKYTAKQILNEWYELKSEDVINFKNACEELQKGIDALEDNYFFRKRLKKQRSR